MRSGLWGHALFLASKMDSRSYNTVLSRCVPVHVPVPVLKTHMGALCAFFRLILVDLIMTSVFSSAVFLVSVF